VIGTDSITKHSGKIEKPDHKNDIGMPSECLFDLTIHNIPERLKQAVLAVLPFGTRVTFTPDLTIHDIPERLKQAILAVLPPETQVTLTHDSRQWPYRIPFLLDPEESDGAEIPWEG
jgi:hypothetical protein